MQAKVERQRREALRNRKQSATGSDTDIDRDGLYAEVAACLILCPAFESEWQEAAEASRAAPGQAARGDPVLTNVEATRLGL